MRKKFGIGREPPMWLHSNHIIIAKQRVGLPRKFNSRFSKETRATFQHNFTKMFQYQYYLTYIILIQTEFCVSCV